MKAEVGEGLKRPRAEIKMAVTMKSDSSQLMTPIEKELRSGPGIRWNTHYLAAQQN